MVPSDLPRKPAGFDRAIGLVLQGGGALGSYQAGVYEALDAAGYLPDWVAGISIGAINAALIAGNPPHTRVAQMRRFWEEITANTALWPARPSVLDNVQRRVGAMGALLFGQPGFFSPRPPLAFDKGHATPSFYTTEALKGTLERLVEFGRINAREMRFSVGAVNVRTGRFAYFDNHNPKIGKIRPEHIMASGALPPGFPAVEIDGECYWDGGLISNTPLRYLLEDTPRVSRLTFQVDLFQAYGPLPNTLDEVAEREKDIRFASRTRQATEAFEQLHNIQSQIHDLWDVLPDEIRKLPQARFLEQLACVTEMDIVQLIYRPFAAQGSAKDYEFSRVTMLDRWEQGLKDAVASLRESPWLHPVPPEVGTRVFDVLHDVYVKEAGIVLGN